MTDPGQDYADKKFDEIVKRIHKVYTAANRDIVERLDAHAKRMLVEDELKRGRVEEGTMTEKAYRKWLNGQVYRSKLWKEQTASITSTLLDANRAANRIIEGERRAVFGENASYMGYQLERGAGMDLSFTVYDSATVTRLLRDDPGLLPKKTVNGPVDRRWNEKKITAIVTRGIVSGASIPEIADMLKEELGSSNEKAMTRYARTAMTGAQNAGRMEVLHEAQAMDIKVKKVWLATLDHRTRPAHQHLDGQVQDVDDPFESDLGPIMYPGDPAADEANTWNCRCTLTYEYEEYPREAGGRYDNEAREDIEDMTYDEWKEWAG
jgi:SPP1 gp7 family putative phage head morphogenesis protein